MNGDEPLGTFIDIPSGTHVVECPTVRKRKENTRSFILREKIAFRRVMV